MHHATRGLFRRLCRLSKAADTPIPDAVLLSRFPTLAEGAAKASLGVKVLFGVILSLSLGASVLGALLLPQKKEAAPPTPAAPPPPLAAAAPAEVRLGLDCYGEGLPKGATARIGSKHWRWRGELYSMAWHPDARLNAIAAGTSGSDPSGRNQSMIVIWAGGSLVFADPGHGHVVRSIAWSSDGSKLASTGGDGRVRVLDQKKRDYPLRATPVGNYESPIFLPGDKVLAVADGPEIVLFDPDNGRELRRLRGPLGNVVCLAASADGKFLASCGDEQRVRLWDAVGWKELRSMNLPKDQGLSVAFSPDSRSLACGTFEGAIVGWDVGTGKELFHEGMPEEVIRSVAFTANGKALIVGGNMVRVWDVARRKEVRHMDHGAPVMKAALSPNGRTIASIGGHGALRLWDLATGAEIVKEDRHYHPVHSIAFSPDGTVVATEARGSPVRLWDAKTGRLLRSLPGTDEVYQIGFLPRSRVLIAGSLGRQVELWDIDKGTSRQAVRNASGPPCPFAVTDDGRTLAGSSCDGRVRVFDLATGRPRDKDFPRWRGALRSALRFFGGPFALTADGSLLAARSNAAGKGLTVWETATHKERLDVPGNGVPLAFSPDGSLLAVRDESAVELYDTATGRKLRNLPCRGLVRAGAFSADGKVLAAGTALGLAHVWEVRTGKERCRFDGHEGSIDCLAFAADCRRLFSAGSDLTGLVWDLASEKGPTTDLKDLWKAMTGEDAIEAHRALWALVEQPGAAEYLGSRVSAVRAESKEKVRSLINDLDNDSFATRESAEAALARLGEAVLPALREAGKDAALPAEPKRRLEHLLARLESWPTQLRAVEVLERIGTPEARRVLRAWADGLPEARLTREAKAALARYRRAGGPP